MSLLAHELRNPLAPILHSAAILRILCTDEAQQRAIATIDRQANLLAHLVDDLVEGARLQTRIGEPRETMGRHRRARGAGAGSDTAEGRDAGQHLAAQLPTGPIQMLCDPVRLRQVLDNLLDNASIHTQAGGTITLEIEVRQDELLIRISDNGLGIAPDALPHVFNMPFGYNTIPQAPRSRDSEWVWR